MAETASDFLIKRITEWGLKRIYGYPGDGINGIIGAIDRAGESPVATHEQTLIPLMRQCDDDEDLLADHSRHSALVERVDDLRESDVREAQVSERGTRSRGFLRAKRRCGRPEGMTIGTHA